MNAVKTVQKLIEKRTFLFLTVIFFVALFLRFHQLATVPPGPDWDEASVGYNAFSIATTARDEWGHLLPHIFEAFGDFKNPLYIYFTSFFVKLFGLSLFSVRMTAAFSGALSVLLIYGIAKEMFAKKGLALLVAFVLALSPPAIFFGRIAGDGMILSAMLILTGIYTELRYLRTKKLAFAIISLAVLLLSLFAYNLARVLSPLFIITFLVINLKQLEKDKKWYLFPAALMIGVALMLIGVQIRLGGASRINYVGIFGSDKSSVLEINQLREDEKNSRLSHLLFNKATLYGVTLFNNYVEHFGSDFLTSYHNQSVVYESFYPIMPIALLPLYYLGLFLATRAFLTTKDRAQKTALFILLAWIVLSPIPSMITEGAPSGKRYLGSLGSHEILIALALVTLLEKTFRNRLTYIGVRVVILVAVFFFLLQTMTFIGDFFGPYQTTHRTLYAGKEDAFGRFVADNYANYDVFIASHQLTGFPYIFPVFYLHYPLNELWKTRQSYQLAGWDYVGRVGKMEFPDRMDFNMITKFAYGNKSVALFLNPQEYKDFTKTAMYRGQTTKKIYDDGQSTIYFVALRL